MEPTLRFDLQGARKELGDEATASYLRENLKTNIDWEYLDTLDTKSALDTLQASDYTIFGKRAENYNIHTQAREDYNKKETPKEYKNHVSGQYGKWEDEILSAGEKVADILDIKPLLNPLVKKITGEELPENILMTKAREQYLKDMQSNVEYKLSTSEDFNLDELRYLKNQDSNKNFITSLFNQTYLQNHIYDAYSQGKSTKEVSDIAHKYFNNEKDILNIDKYEDLNQDQKQIIDNAFNVFDDLGHWWSNTSNQKRLEEYKEKKNAEIITQKATQALVFLDNTESYKDIFSAIARLSGSKEDMKKRNEYLDRVENIALSAGFSGVATDSENEVYFFKENKEGQRTFYKPNVDFFANFKDFMLSNAGGIAGSIYGFKKGYEKGGLKKGIMYSAGGAFAGGALDYALASQVANREGNFSDMLRHAMQEGTLNLVADVGFQGLKYAGKKLHSALKNNNNALGTILDYTPVVGILKRWHTSNSSAAYELVYNTMSKEQLESVKNFAKDFGGELTLNAQKDSTALNALKNQFGENSPISKIAQWSENTFSLKNQANAQRDFIQAIRADESGNLIGFLTQVAKDSPKLQANLSKILNTTTNNLVERLKHLHIDEQSIKDIFNSLEKGTKKDYEEAIEGVLSSVYDSGYKTKIDKSHYNAFRKQLDEMGILPEDSMRFLNFVEKNIYNDKGVTFSQLNNALKNLNSYYKQSLDPNFKSFVKQVVDKRLREDIQKGVQDIFSQNATLYKDAQTLFSTALSDYAKMKDTLKAVDRLKLRDEALSQAKAFDNLYKYLKGQGGESTNYAKLTQSLSQEAKASFELQTLQGIFQKTLRDFNNIKVFDSETFFKRLSELGNTFETKEAKDYIAIAKGFHTLFKNDTLIAQSLGAPLSKEVGSSIATTLQGAIRFQVVKILFEAFMRLMPKIPFATGFNEKIQGMALRFHLRKALSQSIDIGEFKFNIQKSLNNPSLNSPTRALLEQITKEVDTLQDEIIQSAQSASRGVVSEPSPTEKTIQAVDSYAQSEEFKALSRDKQEAILSLKNIQPSPMPKEISEADFLNKEIMEVINKDNFLEHLKNSKDKKRLEFLNLVEPTLKEYDITLKTRNNKGEATSEFIKAFQSKDNQIYYIIITPQENNKILLTGIPTTKIREIRNRIKNADEVKARDLGEISSAHSHTKSPTAPDILPQSPKQNQIIEQVSQNTKAISDDGLPKEIPQNIKEIIDTGIQKGRDMPIIGKENFTPEVVEYIQKQNKKIAIEKLSEGEAKDLGFKYPQDTRVTIDSSAVNHTLNRHGAESSQTLQSRQEPIDYLDISKYRDYAKNADETLKSVDNMGLPVIVSYKQINGHYIIVEELRKGQNELSFKTMFKERGNYKDSVSYKETSQISNATEGYEPTANSFDLDKAIIPKNPQDLPTSKGDTPAESSLFKAEDITFTDKKGKEHTLTKEVQEQWLKTFNLKSLDEDFIPNFTPEVREALSKEGIGEIHLKAGSLVKLEKLDRLEMIPYIKETLENSDVVAKDQKEILFIKMFERENKEKFFVSVAKDFSGEWIFSSHTFREANNIKNKLKNGNILYEKSLKGEEVAGVGDILESGGTTTKPSPLQIEYPANHSSGKSDNTILPQTPKSTQEVIKEAKEVGKSGKEIVQAIKENINEAQLVGKIEQLTKEPTTQAKQKLKRNFKVPKITDDYIKQTAQNPLKDYQSLDLQQRELLKNAFLEKLKNTRENSKKWRMLKNIVRNFDSFDELQKLKAFEEANKGKFETTQELETAIKNLFEHDKELKDIFKTNEKYLNEVIDEEHSSIRELFIGEYPQETIKQRILKYLKLKEIEQRVIQNTGNETDYFSRHDIFKAMEYFKRNKFKTTTELYNDYVKLHEGFFKGDNETALEMLFYNLEKQRNLIELYTNTKPIKDFGTNYAEFYHDGGGAVQKLLNEAQDYELRKQAGNLSEAERKQDAYKGQVSGAFYRKELGDIDLVWGDSKFGLKHILDKHGGEFKDIAKELDEIIQNGEVVKTHNGYNITLGDYKVGLNIGWNENGVKIGKNKWVVTAFDNSKLQSEKQGSNSVSFTKGETLPLNSNAILPQQPKSTQEVIKEAKEAGKSGKEIVQAIKENKELQQKSLLDTQEPQAEPKPQAKADEEEINPSDKPRYRKHERPIELDFQEAIDKGFNVDINALKHFYNNGGASPLNYMKQYMAELDQIEKKGLGNEAKDKLKTLYEDLFYSVKAVETHNPNEIAKYSSIGGEKEIEKIKEFRNEIQKAPTNQKALDALEKIEFVNNLENSPAFKLSKKPKTIKKEFIKEARNALKQATNLELKPLSNFLIKYGKSEEFLTKSSIIRKIEFENIRWRRQRNLNIKPIEEFGTNYAEFYHDGAGAIKKLLVEKQGQVSGAFYRKDLEELSGSGDIDLVWGEVTDKVNHKGYGLAHILDKHPDFDIRLIPEIIEKGNLINQNNIRYRIEKDNYVIGLSAEYKGDKRNFIITAFEKNKDKRDTFTEHPFTSTSDNAVKNLDKKENAESLYASSAITKGETLPLNSKDILPQQSKVFDILQTDRKITDEQMETLLKEIKDNNLKVNLPLSDDEPVAKALKSYSTQGGLTYSQKALLYKALENQLLAKHKNFIQEAGKTQSKAEFQNFLKQNKSQLVQYLKDKVINDLDYIDYALEGRYFTEVSALKRAKEMIEALENGKDFYLRNDKPLKVAPKGHFVVNVVQENPNIKGLYKVSQEAKLELINELKQFVRNNQNLQNSLDDLVKKTKEQRLEQEILTPKGMILENSGSLNKNGYDENLEKELKEREYLLNVFDRVILKSPIKTHSDTEIIAQHFDKYKGFEARKEGTLNEINQARKLLQKELNIEPIKDFGTNYAEFYHDGAGAIKKLLVEKQGQVSGAFYRKDLEELSGSGDIDLVWGNDKIGLQKILEKHIDDFKEFAGNTKEQKLVNGLSEIVEKGKMVSENNVNTIIYTQGDNTYRLGLSQGWNRQGYNNWIITAYKVDKSPHPDVLPSSEVAKSDGTNLHSNDLSRILPQQPKSTQEVIKEAKEAGKSGKEIVQAIKENKKAQVVAKEVQEQKEAKGLFNVGYNGKNATRVLKDLENVEEVIRFSQGNKNKGAKHIRFKHSTDENQEGYIKPLEIASLGKDLREFLKEHEPFMDKNGANVYEWENKEGIRFRLVVNEIKGEADSNPAQLSKPFNEEIITFYSDRNLKERMKFKNPILKKIKE